MKPEELRIGNWGKLNGEELIVLGITYPEKDEYWVDYRVRLKDHVNTTTITQMIEPIPLTEEWLERFGWEEIGERLCCRRWRLNRVDIYKMFGGNYPFYFRFNQTDLKVEHVHQLQNLYYALTGTELNLNP